MVLYLHDCSISSVLSLVMASLWHDDYDDILQDQDIGDDIGETNSARLINPGNVLVQ